MKWLILLLLVACTPAIVPVVTNNSIPIISTNTTPTDNTPTEVMPLNNTKNTTYTTTIPSTPLHECTIITEAEGHELCGTDAQRSGLQGITCRQVFRHNETPFQYIVLDFLNYTTNEEAQKKYTFDRKKEAQPEINNSFEYIDNDRTRTIEFANKEFVVRIQEVKKGACKDFEGLKKLVLSRLK